MLGISVIVEDMAQRAIEAPAEDWKRLGDVVANRREGLKLLQRECVELSNNEISLAVWSILENGNQKNGRMAVRTLRTASTVLDWTPDSLERVLRGEQPLEATATAKIVNSMLDSLTGAVDRRSMVAIADTGADLLRLLNMNIGVPLTVMPMADGRYLMFDADATDPAVVTVKEGLRLAAEPGARERLGLAEWPMAAQDGEPESDYEPARGFHPEPEDDGP